MDGCLVQLSTLLSNLPLLERLDLSSCGFTVKLFQKDRLQFATALQGKYSYKLPHEETNIVANEPTKESDPPGHPTVLLTPKLLEQIQTN